MILPLAVAAGLDEIERSMSWQLVAQLILAVKPPPVIALLELKESVKQPVAFVAKIIPGLAVPEKDPSSEAEVFDPSYKLKISTLF